MRGVHHAHAHANGKYTSFSSGKRRRRGQTSARNRELDRGAFIVSRSHLASVFLTSELFLSFCDKTQRGALRGAPSTLQGTTGGAAEAAGCLFTRKAIECHALSCHVFYSIMHMLTSAKSSSLFTSKARSLVYTVSSPPGYCLSFDR